MINPGDVIHYVLPPLVDDTGDPETPDAWLVRAFRNGVLNATIVTEVVTLDAPHAIYGVNVTVPDDCVEGDAIEVHTRVTVDGDYDWNSSPRFEIFNGAAILRSIQADISLDKTGTPWKLVAKIRGTATELFRKQLYQASGAAVTNADHLVGSLLENAP